MKDNIFNVLKIATFVSYIIAFALSVFRFTADNPVELIMTITGFAGAGISLIMIIAKYRDKATRNSK